MFILHIDSSANTKQSISRSVSQHLVEELKAKYPEAEIKHLDLTKNPVPVVDDSWISERHNHATDELTGDLLKADIIVIGTPMYNYTIPASLKAYIDQVLVPGVTFKYTAEGPVPLTPPGKKVYIALASATNYNVLNENGMNFLEPYLRFILGYIGITDVEVLAYNGRGEDQVIALLEQAKKDVKTKVEKHEHKKDGQSA